MSCFPPPQYRHLKWHVIQGTIFKNDPELAGMEGIFERAEWVPNDRPDENYGYWVRWGYCGDFSSLCKAAYIGPAQDQESPYRPIDERMIPPESAAR